MYVFITDAAETHMLTSGAMSFTGFRRTYLLQNKSDKCVLILSQHRLPVGGRGKHRVSLGGKLRMSQQ